MQIERKIFRPLLLDNRNILCKHLVVEVERLLERRILVEVAAEGNEQLRLAGGHGGRRVQDVKQASSGKSNGQFRGEGQKDLKSSVPLKAGRERWPRRRPAAQRLGRRM